MTQQTERDALRDIAEAVVNAHHWTFVDFQSATTPAKVIELLDAMEAQALRIAELEAETSRLTMRLKMTSDTANGYQLQQDTLRAELDATLHNGHNAKHWNMLAVMRHQENLSLEAELDALKAPAKPACVLCGATGDRCNLQNTSRADCMITPLQSHAKQAQDVNAESVHGFNRDDLTSVADGLESGYESAVDVGDASVESSTAYAARFIRTTLANAKPAQPLTDADIEALAHRTATKYTHRSDPAYHSYGFVRHTLLDFVRKAIEAHIKGQA